MQIIEKKVDGLSYFYEIALEESVIKESLEVALFEKSKSVRMHGFRTGKVPMDLIRKNYSDQLRFDVIEKVMEKNARDILIESGVRPLGEPLCKILSYDIDNVKFSMSFEILPEFSLKPLDGVTVAKYVTDVTDDDVQEYISSLASNTLLWKECENCSVDADSKIIANCTMKILSKKAEILERRDQEFILKDYGVSVEPLFGAKVGERRSFSFSYPKDWFDIKLAGKNVEHHLEITKVLRNEQASVSDELAVHFRFGNLNEMKEFVKSLLMNRNNGIIYDQMKRCLLDQLASEYIFDVPERLVKIECKNIVAQVKKDAEENNLKQCDGTEELLERECKELALRRVRLGLVVAEFAKKNNIVVNNQDMQDAVEMLSRRFGTSHKVIVDALNKNGSFLNATRAELLEKKTIDVLLTQIKIEEKPIAVKELIALEEEVFEFFDKCFKKDDNQVCESVQK